MKPGNEYHIDFMTSDERLEDVVEWSESRIRSTGCTHEQIADRLEQIVHQFYRKRDMETRSVKDSYMIEDRYIVYSRAVLNPLQCPFYNKLYDKDQSYGDEEFTITTLNGFDTISFNSLFIHMIRHHHFYGSSDVIHKLDPVSVVRFFDLDPNVCYAPDWQYGYMWMEQRSIAQLIPSETEKVIEMLSISYIVMNDIRVYLTPCNTIYWDWFKPSSIRGDNYKERRRSLLQWEKEKETEIFNRFGISFKDNFDERLEKECKALGRYIRDGELKGIHAIVFVNEQLIDSDNYCIQFNLLNAPMRIYRNAARVIDFVAKPYRYINVKDE